MLHKQTCIDALQSAGISYHDAIALRRISMTLHRWHELECGDGNQYSSWCIVRGAIKDGDFYDDDDGAPHLETHSNTSNTRTRYVRIPDRERGALKRLAAILARYPGFASYVQGDPRGCALYILRPDDMAAIVAAFSSVDAMYNRGIAVGK